MPVTFINWLISEKHPFAPAAYKALGPPETSSQSQGKAERRSFSGNCTQLGGGECLSAPGWWCDFREAREIGS